MKKRDLLTGEIFEATRSNQKFANPGNRIKYYNDKANTKRLRYAYINKPLHINHTILNELLEGKKQAVFHREFLVGKGYSFEVHTHFAYYDDKKHIAVYEYITIPLDNNQIKIIKT